MELDRTSDELRQLSQEWSTEVSHRIARAIRRRREERGMRQQDLSDACAGLGVHLSRGSIAKLDLGQRDISVAEWLACAKALDVPPVDLLLPLGTEPDVRITPLESQPTIEAYEWLVGTMRPPSPAYSEAARPLGLLLRHKNEVIRYTLQTIELAHAIKQHGATSPEAEARRVSIDASVQIVGQLRAELSGLTGHEGLPVIPSELARQIGEA